MKQRRRVVVGNVGTVYDGDSVVRARRTFDEYVVISKSGQGRAGGEIVCLFRDEDLIAEHVGSNKEEES